MAAPQRRSGPAVRSREEFVKLPVPKNAELLAAAVAEHVEGAMLALIYKHMPTVSHCTAWGRWSSGEAPQATHLADSEAFRLGAI